MLELPEACEEVEDWLDTLRLSQYLPCFQQGGYRALADCKDLTDERLLELGVLPTGHRRRILRSLEALGVNSSGAAKPKLFPRHIFLNDKKRGNSCLHSHTRGRKGSDHEGSQTLPPGAGLGSDFQDNDERKDPSIPQPAPRNPENVGLCTLESIHIPPSMSSASSSSRESFSFSETPSDWEVSTTDLSDPACGSGEISLPAQGDDAGGFHGEMVENDIYGLQMSFKVPKGPQRTRSYRLRHRPVPKLPTQDLQPPDDRSTALVQTANPEHLTASEGSVGSNGTQKALFQRTLTPPGEIFLPKSGHISPGRKEVLQQHLKSKIKQKKQRKKMLREKHNEGKESPHVPPVQDPDVDEYSTVEECTSMVSSASFTQPEVDAVLGSVTSAPAAQDDSVLMVECDIYSETADLLAAKNPERDISPYACFYGAPHHQVLKVGWLDKLSPQGKCVFQKRWVRFDGESLAYYNNDKEMYSKGMILASAIRQVRSLGDINKFEVVTSLRTFIFRAEREGERQEWMETLQMAMRPSACSSQKRSDSLSSRASTNKCGLLELRGYKGKVLVSLAGSKVRLCKTVQDFKAGLAICEVELTAANMKDVDRRGFELNTPFKNFCFTAESEKEKEEWIEVVQESIAETLSDYEVAEKIWFNESNMSCADCRAEQPEWASVNLGVVICKKCSGQHRSLGPNISKVRSLKLDSSIWSNELVELFLEIGNVNANCFWAANLPVDEEIYSGASAEQRATFIRRKYRERKYRKILEGYNDLDELNQALCAAVVKADVLQTMALVFSGADVMCATGDPTCSTPYLLAQRAGQKLQMEFLHQNKLCDFPPLDQWSENASLSESSLYMDGFLYIAAGQARALLDRRLRDDLMRRWCTLEGGFLSYYESERSPSPVGRLDVTEVVSMAISNTETMTAVGAVFTAELYLQTERVLVVGAETQETQHDWIQALTKCFVPSKVERLVQRDSELIGRLLYKEGHDLYHWRMGWFMLEGSALHFSSGEEEDEEEVLQLKQLQELTVTTHTEGEEKIQVLLMVESGRTVYIHGYSIIDFTLWRSAITQAAGTDGNALSDQQLTKNGVPIIVESCIAFVTQYGLPLQGVYQRPGDPARVALLLEEFSRDARNVKLRVKEHHLEDVTSTLKSFLSQAEDALLTKELYPYWVSVLDEQDEGERVIKYSTFIESLPKTNRSTLDALLKHLYRIHQCSHLNQMTSEKLATAFSCCMFQTQGQTRQEINVICDLINNYVTLFSVNEEQVQQMERENSFITRWNDKKDTTFSPAGDLIFEVYLEKKAPENCCLIKVSPSMRATELAENVFNMRNVALNAEDFWTTFEVIENGELERPLHQTEKILEQVLEWSSLDSPQSAFLVLKTFDKTKPGTDKNEEGVVVKGEHLKFRDGSSKLLQGNKFQDRYVVLQAEKLLLYRDMKSTKVEKSIQLKSVKCYLGLKKKIKPPTSFGFSVYTDKLQWHFCCEKREAQVSWVTEIIRMKFGADLCSVSPRVKDAAVPSSTKGGVKPEGGNQVMQNSAKMVTEKKTVIGQRLNEMLKVPEVAQGRTSADACHPRRVPSPSPSMQLQPAALPAAQQSRSRAAGKRSSVNVEGKMPSNLLNELNSVLNKTGRSTSKH
ncbi:arf-GAP with Rho-GAP domain, ANK repeat and PH domain-containing protein 2 isoform 1-T2 [Synchiropus picturatus]